MNNVLNDSEKKILGAIQNGMPMSRCPYQDLSKTIGIPVDQLLTLLRCWQAEGKIRRLGAVINHFQAGHGTGAMVAWRIPQDRVDAAGRLFASFSKVSHVYRRPSKRRWPYNMYTMVHAANPDELEAIIAAMTRQSGVTDCRVLKTVKELKKVPPAYIAE